MSPIPPLHESLRAEYETVQEKIDKLGEFKFQVRGWSLTLQTALAAALLSGRAPTPTHWWAYSGIAVPFIIIALFHMLEQHYEFQSNALGQRALKLERCIDLLTIDHGLPDTSREGRLSSSLRAVESAPMIGRTLQDASRYRWRDFLTRMLNFKMWWFYYIQYLLAALAIGVSMGVEYDAGKGSAEKPAAAHHTGAGATQP